MEELEIMRRELAELKRRLDTQQIVNKGLLSKLMRRKASWLNRLVVIEMASLPFIYLVFAVTCYAAGISQWYASLYLIFGAIDVLVDCRTVRIPPRMFSEASLIGLRKFLIRQKRERFIQTVISTPLAVAWVVAFAISLFSNVDMNLTDDSTLHHASLVGGICGGAIGAVLGVVAVIILYRKIERTNDSIIADIHDLEQEE